MTDEHETMMRMMTIPGLSGARRLEDYRMESMRNARANLSRQTRSRLVTSVIGQMKVERDKTR